MVSTVETMQLESVISSEYSSGTARVLRVINNLKLRVAPERIKGLLTASEYQQAEFLWIRSIQNLERKKPNFQPKSYTLDCMKTRMEFNDVREGLEMRCCHLMQGVQYFYPQITI